MDKLREGINEINSIVKEAFDDIEILECTPEGLFNYIKDGNEAFMYDDQEDDKLCYLYAFKYYAQEINLDFPQNRMDEINSVINNLKEKYPEHFEIIASICCNRR